MPPPSRSLAALFVLTLTLVGVPSIVSFAASPSQDTIAVSTREVTFSLSPATPVSVTGGDDIRRLKRLAAGVGWEFSPNAETTAGLKRIGIKTIRGINVDGPFFPGHFADDGRFVMDGRPQRLDAHLKTCEELQARPHLILGERPPAALRIPIADAKERLSVLGQQLGKRTYWNGDWPKMRAFWKEIFRYTLIERGFTHARFEIGNEPDIDGQFPRLVGGEGTMGSAALYRMYFDIYKNVTLAAAEFEAENPGRRVQIGGPALAWAYTFRFGDFNWLEKFLADAARENLRLDFIGVHFYGNITSLTGAYPTLYPPFTEMLASARRAQEKHFPGVPIFITEWGPSYHTANKPEAWINANHIGAAWSAAFLKTMLEQKVEEALFLVTTDLAAKNPESQAIENGWGWPSFFVNPKVFDHAWPKAPLHVIDMVNRLQGTRVAFDHAGDGGKCIDGIASTNTETGRTTILLWNYDAMLPEKSAPARLGEDAVVTVRLGGLASSGSTLAALNVKTWLVSETMSDARSLFEREGRLDARSELQLIEEKTLPGGVAPACTLTLPKCSVAFMEITPVIP